MLIPTSLRPASLATLPVSLIALISCGEAVPDERQDAAHSDSAILNDSATESGTPDAATIDARQPDGASTDSALPDGASTDSALPDGASTDSALPDGGSADAALPDASASDAALPEVTITGTGRFRRLHDLTYPGLPARDAVVFLPTDYDTAPARRYPVLYMHDAQNLFDPAQAGFGVEWQVDETLDALVMAGAIGPHIVVGVDNTAQRISDYTPDVDSYYGGGNGDAYADLLAFSLKPIVDAHFRTEPDRLHTAVMGSSLGGLISLHVAMRHPGVFGRIGCVSPSLWWNERSILSAFEAFSGVLPLRLWVDMGTAEGDPDFDLVPEAVANTRDLRSLAIGKGMALGHQLGYLEEAHAEHNEASWAGRLDAILRYLLSDETTDGLDLDGLALFPFHRHLSTSASPGATGLTVEVRYTAGLRHTPPNSDVTLDSLAPSIASVTSDGTISANSDGAATITADFGGQSASSSVTVGDQAMAVVTFVVDVPASTPSGDTVFLSGDHSVLGQWDGAGVAMSEIAPYRWQADVVLPWDTYYEFKLTRGGWATVEKDANGDDIPNRTAVAATEMLQLTVARWADQ